MFHMLNVNIIPFHHTESTYCRFHFSEIRNQAKLIYRVRIVIVFGSHEPERGVTTEASWVPHFLFECCLHECVQFVKSQVVHL